jgi:hypothetical protein
MKLNIPEEALFHPAIKKLEDLTCELIAFDNVSHQVAPFLHDGNTFC